MLMTASQWMRMWSGFILLCAVRLFGLFLALGLLGQEAVILRLWYDLSEHSRLEKKIEWKKTSYMRYATLLRPPRSRSRSSYLFLQVARLLPRDGGKDGHLKVFGRNSCLRSLLAAAGLVVEDRQQRILVLWRAHTSGTTSRNQRESNPDTSFLDSSSSREQCNECYQKSNICAK